MLISGLWYYCAMAKFEYRFKLNGVSFTNESGDCARFWGKYVFWSKVSSVQLLRVTLERR